MGRGRPNKPTALHLAEGTFRRNRHGSEPVIEGEPTRPRGLPKVARQLWDSVVPKLVAAGVATEIDETMLQHLCIWYSRYVEETKHWGENYRTDVRSQIAWKNFSQLAARFGMTPSDRAKLKVNPEDTSDPLLQMMGGN